MMPNRKFLVMTPILMVVAVVLANPSISDGQEVGASGSLPPSAGFRPLGQPGRAALYNRDDSSPSASQQSSPAATQSGVMQTAYRQGGFVTPDLGATQDNAAPPVTGRAAPAVGTPSAPPLSVRPAPTTGNSSGGGLPPGGYGAGGQPLVRGNQNTPVNPQPLTGQSPSDLTPVPSPQMNQNWATTGTSPLVTAPSGYRAEFWECGAPMVIPAGGNPYIYYPATVMPNAPQAVAVMPSAGPRPLFTLGQENYNVQLGQGIIGQPTAYVVGQPIRNFFRYLAP
jgi:hypothetical protein